jgi:hypothetical protein
LLSGFIHAIADNHEQQHDDHDTTGDECVSDELALGRFPFGAFGQVDRVLEVAALVG